MTDFLTIGIGVAVIIVIIIMLIAVIAIVIRALGLFDSPPPDLSETRISPEIWGLQEKVGDCIGYRIPPINETTPSNAVNYSLDVSDLVPRPAFSCLWQDEINRQMEEATCLSQVCTDQYGLSHTQGQIITYPTYCPNNTRCTGTLGVIPIGNGGTDYECINSPSLSTLGTATCNLFDDTQYFIRTARSGTNDFLVRLDQRETSYSLTAVDNRVALGLASELANEGYQWIILPEMTVPQGSVVQASPAQIAFVGDLDPTIINDPSYYTSITALRNLLLLYGVNTLSYNLTLQPWEYGPISQVQSEQGTYNDQASAFVSINRMSDIPIVLQ